MAELCLRKNMVLLLERMNENGWELRPTWDKIMNYGKWSVWRKSLLSGKWCCQHACFARGLWSYSLTSGIRKWKPSFGNFMVETNKESRRLEAANTFFFFLKSAKRVIISDLTKGASDVVACQFKPGIILFFHIEILLKWKWK